MDSITARIVAAMLSVSAFAGIGVATYTSLQTSAQAKTIQTKFMASMPKLPASLPAAAASGAK
ncbi:hypothetical protein THIX_60500 [Thiomonas sp. X19]|uniref:hypothetical protein n=1 Tax=Thiomonas sp. X19 TaxID=1050370 RepID=UPI000B737AE5|nr:hypothetical protein [Thiomonas sp. X19]SCC94442.1 hypothetical protein THIX_60500 [Thiomonas sp. X19]